MTKELAFEVQLSVPYDQALEKVAAALKTEGFGILTRIDAQATFKEKIGAEFRPYAILGACNPPLAHRALSANLDVGLLLPCNVTVYEEGEGSVVTAADPVEILGVLKEDPMAHEVAVEARTRLQRVIASLK